MGSSILNTSGVKVGDHFYRLVVEEIIPTNVGKPGQTGFRFRCRCSCGNVLLSVPKKSLVSGNTRSCGCWQRDAASRASKKHGMSRSPEYTCWCAMIRRCYDKDNRAYENYGGRGIYVCKRWRGKGGFERFFEDMGARPSNKHSIDRIDNNGPYSKSNCRWATRTEQNNNRRLQKNERIIEFGGETLPIKVWAKRLGMSTEAIRYRLSRYPLDVALSAEKRPGGCKITNRPSSKELPEA